MSRRTVGVIATLLLVPAMLLAKPVVAGSIPDQDRVAVYQTADGGTAIRPVDTRRISVSGSKPQVPIPLPDPSAPNPLNPGTVIAIRQIGHVATGFDATGNPLPVPSIDPAGVLYHAPLGGLLIVDSEITEVPEVFDSVGATLFSTSTYVDITFFQWDLSAISGVEPFRNRESTGIGYCESDGHFYVTNDDLKLILRYQFDSLGFSVVDFVSTVSHTNDPEGITCDPQTGRIYVIGGSDANIVVYTYQGGFVFQEVLNLEETAEGTPGVLIDAEGIAFDPISGHLFVVSDLEKAIVEYDLAGHFVNIFDISDLRPTAIAPQGLSIGPSNVDPDKTSFYISDGGLDNDQVPSERDGAIYELLMMRQSDFFLPLGQ